MRELIRHTKIDFMGKRRYMFILSAVITAIGILALIQIARGAANLGIDFTGGTAVQIKFEKPIVLSEVRKTLEEGGLKDFDLQDMPVERKILIRVKKQEEILGGFSEKIVSQLSARFSDQRLEVESTTEIGPKVGERLRNDALLAIVFATAGLLAYIAWRFQFKFGVGATIAMLHDVIGTLAVFYIMNIEINLVIISALLAIAGYSLTDTVVVFDRIRENLKIRFRESVETIVNQSINEVLSRTIITTLTTLLAALALFFFGGEVIHDFAFAIIIGIIIGTYSSIFVASPVVLLWGGKRPFAKK